MTDTAAILAELARVKALFQARTLEAILRQQPEPKKENEKCHDIK